MQILHQCSNFSHICKQTLNRNAISGTRRGRGANNLFCFEGGVFGFFLNKCLDHLHLLKRFFSPEETVRHVKQRHGHLGGGISSTSCDRRLNYNGDPGDPLSFKAERRPNVAGENRSERPTSGSNQSVCALIKEKMSQKERRRGGKGSGRGGSGGGFQ